jgi:hypothetical protein
VAKTAEEILQDLNVALEEAREVTRDLHIATKDLKQLLKVERAKHEEIVRLETHNTILDIARDIHDLTQKNVDEILAQLRARLLGEEDGS